MNITSDITNVPKNNANLRLPSNIFYQDSTHSHEKTDNKQKEDILVSEQITLCKVSYFYDNHLLSMDLILNKNKKKNGQENSHISNKYWSDQES